MRKTLEREEAELAAEIARFEREIDVAPMLLRQQIESLQRRRAESNGFIEAAHLTGTSLRDIRQGLIKEEFSRKRDVRRTRTQRRNARIRAMIEFLILAAIFALCLKAAVSMVGVGR